jgi:hypothetical protein
MRNKFTAKDDLTVRALFDMIVNDEANFDQEQAVNELMNAFTRNASETIQEIGWVLIAVFKSTSFREGDISHKVEFPDREFQKPFEKTLSFLTLALKNSQNFEFAFSLMKLVLQGFESFTKSANPCVRNIVWSEHDSSLFESQLQNQNFPFRQSFLFAENKHIRSGALLTLGVILEFVQSAGNEIHLDAWVDIIESCRSLLLVCSDDKTVLVRHHSILMLQYFQDTSSPDTDDVIQRLLWMLTCDPCKNIRIECLQILEITENTLTCMLTRCFDVDDDVRICAFSIILNFIRMQAIRISTRIEILFRGLQDCNISVQELAQNILWVWFDKSQFNFSTLLLALDSHHFKKECTLILKNLISGSYSCPKKSSILQNSIREQMKIFQILSNMDTVEENLLIFDVVCNFVTQKSEFLNNMDDLIPDVMALVELMLKFKDSDNEFILCALVKISKFSNPSNEAGIRKLFEFYESYLLSERENVFLSDSFCENASSIIDNIFYLHRYDFFEDLFRIIRTRLNSDEHQDNDFLCEISLLLATLILRRAPDNEIVHIWEIIQIYLNIESFLIFLLCENEELRSISLEFFSVYSIIEKTPQAASTQIPILIESLKCDSILLKTKCIKAIFDLILVFDLFGQNGSNLEDEANEAIQNAFDELINLMCSSSEFQYLVIQGFCKLLLHGRINFSMHECVLLRLILLRYSSENSEGITREHVSRFLLLYVKSVSLAKAHITNLIPEFIIGRILENIEVHTIGKEFEFLSDLLDMETSFGANPLIFFEDIIFNLGCICISLNISLEELWKIILLRVNSSNNESQYVYFRLLKKFSYNLSIEKMMKNTVHDQEYPYEIELKFERKIDEFLQKFKRENLGVVMTKEMKNGTRSRISKFKGRKKNPPRMCLSIDSDGTTRSDIDMNSDSEF